MIVLQVAEYEATTFSIFYNNSLFLALVIIASFYILSVSDRFTFYKSYFNSVHFQGTSPHMNYALSIGLSSGLIALLSTGTRS